MSGRRLDLAGPGDSPAGAGPPDGAPPPAARRGILSEETILRPGQADVENPYWELEEPAEHPDPERGCIRRGLCCRSSPGWFAPGEVEAAAAHLGLTPDAFVRRYAIIESIEVDGQRVELFAPVKLGRDGAPQLPPATRADRLYGLFRGPCVFYGPEGCGIYPARPAECRAYVCTNAPEDNLSHEELGRLWLAAARGEEPPVPDGGESGARIG